MIERTDTGWQTVVDGGPSGNGNDAYGADVTDDGKRLWFVGASGAIGEYDVETGNLVDHSAPNDVTNNFNDVAVTGNADEANVYVAGDSGGVYYSFENGATGSWNSVTVGQGAAIKAIDFYDPRKGHLVNGNANVFSTADGTTWNKIGIADADVSLYGVDSNAKDDVWVAAGSGVVYQYTPDADGTPQWVRTKVGEPGLRDIEVDAGDGYVVGNSEAVFDRADGAWSRDETPSGQNLNAVIDQADNDIAVGAAGTIIATNPDAEAADSSTDDDQSGHAARIERASTNTNESKTLTFTLENTGDQSVTFHQWALETTVQVESIQRSGAEVTVDATAVDGDPDGFPVDSEFRTFTDKPKLQPGETGTFDFGQYDNGNVALTIEPATERPDGEYISASFSYSDGTAETFYFRITNVNS
ncbi:MAG: hypothetical protein SVG88_10180 [Halobacteriales archaeon]|nr:hypothetical protein [Halobacteriales archaeon]